MLISSNSAVVKALISVALAVASFFCNIFGLPTYPHGKTVDMSKFELVWSDEFDGDELNTRIWSDHYGYTADASGTFIRRGGYWNQKMCSVENGALHIATRYYPDGFEGNGKPGWYTSGIDTSTSYKQKHGYFECRCILPKGVGLWSAFWIYSGDEMNIGNGGVDGSEIDVFESAYYANKRYPNSVSSAIHYDGYGEYHKSKLVCWSRITENDPYEEFNTYGVEWNEDEYIFYINGVEAGRTKFGGASQMEEWLILSVEVGGEGGVPSKSWAGESIDDNTEAPTDFVVDYVRAYQYK